MKTQKEIDEKVAFYIGEISKLEKEIDKCLRHQKESGHRITRDCDYIKGREVRLLVFEAKLEVLNWVQ